MTINVNQIKTAVSNAVANVKAAFAPQYNLAFA